MSFLEILRFAVRGVTANKLRSALTMLGVLIGVGAVILLVAVGNGSAQQIADRIAALGTNTLTVQSTSRGGSSNTAITVQTAEALQDPVLAPDVKSVSPVVSTSATITYQGTDHSVQQFVGTYPSYFTASNTPVGTGAAFTGDDLAQGRRVVLIGTTVAEELFAGTDPIGQQVTVSGALFTVVGVLDEKSATSGFQDANDVAVAPLTAVQQALTGYGAVSSVIVEAASTDKVDDVQAQIATILDQRLKVSATSGGNSSTPYRIQNASQLLETQTETANTFTVLLGAVAGISLLVGGIGITNIMLVTVTERTREIGIRKALGAPRRAILTQFLAEATMLSLIGGGLGVAAALIGSQFSIVGIKPVIVPSSIALALGVSVAIGLFFGSVPASRAAGLRPIDALRYE
ncbi:ABC transporter permease [Micromonospora endophytica]|uniref:Macrolide ABC transporter permease n=1 Tax=Micromonospora endophytica TaxID=515350 RepID=A0A2W2BWJ7_9ACTN|nr:ABC transporter permease [Micromonospora endophytica]PZF89950.1 macrolide ABC transporter permease [Micromonospora endophytica]RIW42637.1 FtsX-like permease family protein [Micromonospora endophytica]BCJ60698.1 peptide ABC transporter permease [Micromonospora endophytica]